jgi:hypothetical protein
MFIRLFALYKYKNNQSIPDLDSDFISYVITTLGTKDTRGKQSKNITRKEEIMKIIKQKLTRKHK